MSCTAGLGRRWTRLKQSHVCICCVSEGVPRRSLAVALVVGTLLNLINQGDAMLGEEPVSLVKLLLTYAVPYGVATYGAVSVRLAGMKTSASPARKGSERASD